MNRDLRVPFFRPDLGSAEIAEVTDVLRSGWLTTGPRVRQFETAFATKVGARHAVAVSSATAALHLAVEALGAAAGQGVLVPTMTFAATAEVLRYVQAVPILVDCEAGTLNMDLGDAERKRVLAEAGELAGVPRVTVTGLIPVHVGGLMLDLGRTKAFASAHGLWVVDDAAHAFPAAWRPNESATWVRCGEATAAVSCFSFYANKTITTGEGGMAVTDDPTLADRMRLMSLHGLSNDAWNRYGGGAWDYRIVAPGFKYNLTDIAAAIGLHQLDRADTMREAREHVARIYREAFASTPEIELPPVVPDRVHAWHLFPIRLRLDRLRIDRTAFITALQEAGVGCSVHWRPLHLHPYYQEGFKWTPEQFPVATREWQRLVSLPIYPGLTRDEQTHVVNAVQEICRASGR